MEKVLPPELVPVLDAARDEAHKMMADDRRAAVLVAHKILSQLGYTPPDIKLAMAIAAYLSVVRKQP